MKNKNIKKTLKVLSTLIIMALVIISTTSCSSESTQSTQSTQSTESGGHGGGRNHDFAQELLLNNGEINIPVTDENLTLDTSKYTYKDGTYEVQTSGYDDGGMKISVTLKDNRITSIDILQQNETPEHYKFVTDRVPPTIIATQSTNVDNISGATMTTQGIIKGVNAVLKQVRVAN